jgi:quercetin dioxygenase-like cupin family protein
MLASGKAFFAGIIVGAAIVAVALGPRAAAADRDAQTAQARYSIKIALENNHVRVRDVTFPPGVLDTGMHTHEYPHVGVILTPGSLTFTEPGKPTETTRFETGSVGFREAHVTHQAANPGTTPMRVIEVELK